MSAGPSRSTSDADAFSASQLAQHALQRRAIEAAIWGMPIVSVDAMRQAFFRDAGATYNDVIYFSRPADWKFQVTTPNASSRYVLFCFNTKAGPVVVDLPAAIGAGLFGSMNDAWQAPVADIGPAGDDHGKGGKYLLISPGYSQRISSDYLPVRMHTCNGYAVFRAIPASAAAIDVGKALDLVKKIRVYPLARAAHPPASRHIDMAGKLFDGIARFDETFYASLSRMVNEEPVQTRDLVAMAQLRSIGIEKGKPFAPDAATNEILRQAIAEAHATFMHGATEGQSFWPGSHWILPGAGVGPRTAFGYETGDRLEIDERGMLFYLGCAPPKKLGAATFYVWGVHDAGDEALRGDRTYRLHVPANVPAKQFWAVTVYDLETAGFMRNSPRLEINSYQQVQKNADGSVDVLFGPSVPVGKEANWVYTAPGKPWISAFRFYGPEPSVFDKSWRLPDIERAI